jgi:glycosyltransferase involved in cell wall biosynthesis
MKILFLTHSLNPRTGIGEFSTNLIDGVRQQLPDVEVSIMTGEDFLKPKLTELFRNWNKIRSEIRNADIVHAIDTYPYGVIANYANFLINKPLIITAIGSGSVQKLFSKDFKNYLLKTAYRKAHTVTAISTYVSNVIHGVIPSVSPIVIHPGIDPSFWADNCRTALDKKLDDLAPYFITVGEFKRRKGYTMLLPILKKAFERNANINYVIVGNQSINSVYYIEVKDLIEKFGVKERITILSGLSREELRAVYKKSIGYILLPQNVNWDIEGFGIAVMEAAASGIPAIIGKGSGADDTVVDGETGYLIEQNKSEDVISKMEVLLQNQDLRTRLSEKAMQRAKKMDWSNQIKKYINIYEKI